LHTLGIAQALRAVASDDIGRRRSEIDQQCVRLPLGDEPRGCEKVCGRDGERIAARRLHVAEAFEPGEDPEFTGNALAQLLEQGDDAVFAARENFGQLRRHRDGVDRRIADNRSCACERGIEAIEALP